MADLNELWEQSKPVQPGSGAPSVVRVPQQPQQPPNASGTTTLDSTWDAAKPINPSFGTTETPQSAPAATSTPEQPASWGDAFGAMVSPEKLKESGIKFVQDTVEGVTKGAHEVIAHPVDAALKVVKKGVQTLAAPLAGPIIPFLPEATQKKIQKIFGGWAPEGDPMVQQLVDRYGSLDKLKQTMAQDPAGTWLDIATLASGGEMAATRAGMTNTARTARAISMIDPMTAASRFVVEPIARNVVPRTLGWRSGVGPETVAEIRNLYDANSEMGQRYGNAGRNEFHDAFTDNVTARQVVDRAEQGVTNMRRDAGAAYRLSKDEWIQHGGTFDFSAIDNAQRELTASMHSGGGIDALEPRERRRFNRLMETVDDVRRRGNWSIDDMDTLAKRMQNFSTGFTDHPQMQRAAQTMKSAVRQSIYDSAPPGQYRDGLRNYHAAMNDLDEMKSALSLGKDASEHTVMTKLQSILRNNVSTQYGARRALVDTLEEEGRVSLRPWLLGMATNADAPRGIAGAMAAGSSLPGVAGGTAGYLGLGPWGLIAAPAAMAADQALRSPRNAARIARTMGEHGDDFSQAFPLLRYGAVSEGHEDRERDRKEKRAGGGRVGFAEGGLAEVDEIVPPAVQRVRQSLFTPAFTAAKINPSRALLAPTPEVRMPQMPSGSASAGGGAGTAGLFDSITKLWNAPSEQRKAQEETARKEEAARLTKEAADLAKTKASLDTTTTPTTTAPAPGTTPGGGVMQGRPLPGDTYEARVRAQESAGNDAAVSSIGASGRYQFLPSTAEGLRKQFPDLKISDQWRTNAEDQEKLMKAYTDQSREILRKTLGREPTGGELYSLHLFGHGGGPRVLGGLTKPITEITTAAERAANPFLNNFKTGTDLINYFNKRFG